jgi:hypothetical protein
MGLMIVARDKNGNIKKDITIDRLNGKRVIEEDKLKKEEEIKKNG